MRLFQRITDEAGQVTAEEVRKFMDHLEPIAETDKVLGEVAADALHLMVLRDKTKNEATAKGLEHLKSHLTGAEHDCAENAKMMKQADKKLRLLDDIFWAECKETIGADCPEVIGIRRSEGEAVIIEVPMPELDMELDRLLSELDGGGNHLEELLQGAPTGVHVIKLSLGSLSGGGRPKSVFERLFR